MKLATLAALVCLFVTSVPRAARADSVQQAIEDLNSPAPEVIRAAIATLALSRSTRGALPLETRIRAGLPADLVLDAAEGIAQIPGRESARVLRDLTRHRRPEVRWTATQGLISTRAQGADEALRIALGDSDPRVRGAAALGLGELGATRYASALFVALDRGVLEAAAALGQLVTPEQVDQLLGYVGRVPFDSLTPAFSALFLRSDIPEARKLALINLLAELATPDARTYLEQLTTALPARPPTLRRAAEQAVGHIPN